MYTYGQIACFIIPRIIYKYVNTSPMEYGNLILPIEWENQFISVCIPNAPHSEANEKIVSLSCLD